MGLWKRLPCVWFATSSSSMRSILSFLRRARSRSASLTSSFSITVPGLEVRPEARVEDGPSPARLLLALAARPRLAPLVLPERRAWRAGLSAAALLFLAVVPVNAPATGRHALASWQAGDTLFLGFDGAMLGLAALLAFAAHTLARYEGRRRTGPRSVPHRAGDPVPAS